MNSAEQISRCGGGMAASSGSMTSLRNPSEGAAEEWSGRHDAPSLPYSRSVFGVSIESVRNDWGAGKVNARLQRLRIRREIAAPERRMKEARSQESAG